MATSIKLELQGITSYGEDASLNNGSDKATNVFLDNSGFFRGRGGLSTITPDVSGASLPSAKIDGLFYWVSKDLTMIVSGGSLYSMNENNFITLIGVGLETNERASFAVVRTSSGVESLAVANGGDIYIYDPVNVTWTNTFTTDNDAPRAVKKIVFLTGYLIALPTNSNRFYFSQVGDPEDWSALDFASAEANADIIENMVVKSFYLYLFGTNTVEVWYNDGSTPFIRLDGGLIENGTASPFSVATVEDRLLFLDNKRRICTVEGQSGYQVISSAIDRFLQSLDSVEDAYAYPIQHQGRVFYAITFPTASRSEWDGSSTNGLTFIYDIYNQQFFEWAEWSSVGSEFGKFPVYSEAYCSLQQRQILGSDSTGKLYELDKDVYQDDGGTLRLLWQSPFSDFGALSKKRIRKMRWRATSGTSSTSYQFQFNKRFDGNSEWNLITPLSLQVGSSSLNQFHVQLNNIGMCRVAQFQITGSTNAPFCMGELTLEIDPMTS